VRGDPDGGAKMIGFAGLSHLGLNYSLATAAKGFDVVAYDPDVALTSRCNAGDFPIEEPGFCELFDQHRARLHYTSSATELAKCELVFYSLDVYTNVRNESDLGPLTALIHATGPHLAAGASAVVLSQVSPGYMRQLSAKLREVSRADFYYQVETLIFGRAVERAMQPERFIVGAADPTATLPVALKKWHAAFGCPVLLMRFESAELAKIAINFFLVSSVTTANTLAEVCERIGADWAEIVPALRLDKRIGPHAYLTPGLGIAGGNLERDLVTVQKIAAERGTEAGVVDAWQTNSRYRRDWALRQVHKFVLSQNAEPRLALWGLAYKQDTHSVKNSPALTLAESLGQFEKIAYDPQVKSLTPPIPNLAMAAGSLEACRDADALIVMTPWREFCAIKPASVRAEMRGNILIDPFGILDEAACREAGFSYHRLGS
jgi:UDPglucose 6-dehydrogenase